MAQWVKVLAIMSNETNLICRTYMVWESADSSNLSPASIIKKNIKKKITNC